MNYSERIDFGGTHVAIPTPLNKDKSVDKGALVAHVDWLIENGVEGIVPLGTTGGVSMLKAHEHPQIIEAVVLRARRNALVIAGAGSNDTEEAMDYAKQAEDAGANGILSVVPYYVKPSQKGIREHFEAQARATELPIFLYDIKPRTGVRMERETLHHLAQIENIKGLKDANGDWEWTDSVTAGLPSAFTCLSGDDDRTLDFIKRGYKGVISVLANILPKEVSDAVHAARSRDFEKAHATMAPYKELNAELYRENNPTGIMTALSLMGRIQENFRGPLTTLVQDNRQRLEMRLREAGLI